ncbi:Eukaryotic translation initiation factor 4E [Diplonema papillatum]|nr:Eukaryotic translation initiation factor 4E [Diplonema papillatum]
MNADAAPYFPQAPQAPTTRPGWGQHVPPGDQQQQYARMHPQMFGQPQQQQQQQQQMQMGGQGMKGAPRQLPPQQQQQPPPAHVENGRAAPPAQMPGAETGLHKQSEGKSWSAAMRAKAGQASAPAQPPARDHPAAAGAAPAQHQPHAGVPAHHAAHQQHAHHRQHHHQQHHAQHQGQHPAPHQTAVQQHPHQHPSQQAMHRGMMPPNNYPGYAGYPPSYETSEFYPRGGQKGGFPMPGMMPQQQQRGQQAMAQQPHGHHHHHHQHHGYQQAAYQMHHQEQHHAQHQLQQQQLQQQQQQAKRQQPQAPQQPQQQQQQPPQQQPQSQPAVPAQPQQQPPQQQQRGPPPQQQQQQQPAPVQQPAARPAAAAPAAAAAAAAAPQQQQQQQPQLSAQAAAAEILGGTAKTAWKPRAKRSQEDEAMAAEDRKRLLDMRRQEDEERKKAASQVAAQTASQPAAQPSQPAAAAAPSGPVSDRQRQLQEENEKKEAERRKAEAQRQKEAEARRAAALKKIAEDMASLAESESAPRKAIADEEDTAFGGILAEAESSKQKARRAQDERLAKEEEEKKKIALEKKTVDRVSFAVQPHSSCEDLGLVWTAEDKFVLKKVFANSVAAKHHMDELTGQVCFEVNDTKVASVNDVDEVLSSATNVVFKFKKTVICPPTNVLRDLLEKLDIEANLSTRIVAKCEDPDLALVKSLHTIISKGEKAKSVTVIKTLEKVGFESIKNNTAIGRLDFQALCFIAAATMSEMDLNIPEVLAQIKFDIKSSDNTVEVDEKMYAEMRKSEEQAEKKKQEEQELKEAEDERQRKATAAKMEALREQAAREEKEKDEIETANGTKTKKSDEKNNPDFHSEWVLFYTPEPGGDGTWVKPKEICTVKDIQSFWTMASNTPAASTLKAKCSYALFRQGIEPTWEDEANKNGGQWTFAIDENKVDDAWSAAVLKVVGETFTQYHSLIAGITIEHKYNWRLSLWLKVKDSQANQKAIFLLGKELKEPLAANNYIGLNSTGKAQMTKFVNNESQQGGRKIANSGMFI